jgi:hypothetical protein
MVEESYKSVTRLANLLIAPRIKDIMWAGPSFERIELLHITEIMECFVVHCVKTLRMRRWHKRVADSLSSNSIRGDLLAVSRHCI